MTDETEREAGSCAGTDAPGRKEADGAAAEAKIADLEEQLRRKAEEAATNYDRYLREVAESENLKKRLQREKSEAIRFANESLIRDVLGIVDNLDRAIEHAVLGGNGQSVVEGVQLTLRLFRDVLERYGVKEIEVAAGARFDPAIHEAADVESGTGQPANTVIRQQAKGYRLHDRLLRAAQVVVAGEPEGEG